MFIIIYSKFKQSFLSLLLCYLVYIIFDVKLNLVSFKILLKFLKTVTSKNFQMLLYAFVPYFQASELGLFWAVSSNFMDLQVSKLITTISIFR